MVVVAYVEPNGGDPLSVTSLTFGAAAVVLACLAPWLESFRASAKGGLQVGLRSASEVSTLLAAMPNDERTATAALGDDTELAQLLLAQIALEAIFEENEALQDCRFHLYLLDEGGQLAPVLDEGTESWPTGVGVVGKAWEETAFVRAIGDECRDGTHGLSAEQQTRHAALEVVAAIPVSNDRGDVIGVVSAGSTSADSRLRGDMGYTEMCVVASLASRVLVDLLKWFPDG